MRTRLWIGLVGAAALIIGAGDLRAQDGLRIEEVKDDLYSIFGSGGNVGVRVTPEGAILIDDKYPQNVEEIRELIAMVTDVPIRYVINTHHHGDHAGGNVGFIEDTEIIAHQNARDNMVRAEQEGQPRMVFTDQTAIYLGGVEVRAHYLGTGHTNGDAVIYFSDLRTVHGGDLLNGNVPFIDYANGGSSAGWVATLNNLLALDWDTAIPGHGEIMTRDDVVAFRNQMEEVRSRMDALIREGVSREEAIERIRSPDLPWTQTEGGLFMGRSIGGVYDEIAAGID